MSVTKPMKEVSVEEILQQYNLIVPEIQREYVWGYNQYGIFETFLTDLKEGFSSESEVPSDIKSLQDTINNPLLDEATKKNLLSLLERTKPMSSMNIGFLYSYRPSYYIGNDREEDLYLIDGQQRFTTLFLTLFYFALKEGRKEDFILLFKFDAPKEKIAFDYRVRSITHQFVIDLIAKSETVADLMNVKRKRWFLANYANDTTVKSITGTNEKTGVFNLLNQFFGNEVQLYYDYIKKSIKFWHFKTEETSQGEELYITMNSRGQQLADNETIRAKLFDNDSAKKDSLYWSEQWELWQDFFWKHRDKETDSVTADEGFNEFLRWVQILKMWEQFFKEAGSSPEDIRLFEKTLQWDRGSKLNDAFLSLFDIKLTFDALSYLYETFISEQKQYKKIYPKSYIADLLPAIWISTTGEPLELINLFQLLPVLHYCKESIKTAGKVNNHTLYRLFRTIRTLSKDTTIGKAVRNQVSNVLVFADKLSTSKDITALINSSEISKTILNEELSAKLELISNANDRERLEDIIWLAEDIGLNHGEILHLINLSKSIEPPNKQFDIEVFEKVVSAYDELMKYEVDVNGNILHTDCYIDSWDRIEYHREWFKKDGLLNLVNERILSPNLPLKEFLMVEQKKFIKQYRSAKEILEESNAAKQLFIYYILTKNDVLHKGISWDWNGHYNFGKLLPNENLRTLFSSGYVFQQYKTAFRENESKILAIHRLAYNEPFERLLEWSRS